MVVPAVVFLAVAHGADGASDGWAIPMATDIAFALAVLAVVGTHLPPALRAFLLTLAVVDDLGAITVIAVLFTDHLDVVALLVAVALLGLYAYLQHRRVVSPWIYVPLALGTWIALHDSGVHATVAGVALGLLTRVKPDSDEEHSPAERLEHRIRPLSAGFAVPIFAFLAAGVPLSGDIRDILVDDKVALGSRARTCHRQVRRGLWGHLAGRDVHPRRAWRWHRLAGHGRTGHAVGNRLHRFLTHRRTGFLRSARPADRRQDSDLAGFPGVSGDRCGDLKVRNRTHRLTGASIEGPGHAGIPQPDRIVREARNLGIEEERMLNGTEEGLNHRPSLGALVADIATDLSQLVRGEIALAKSEIRESAKRGATGAALIGAASAFLLMMLLMLTWAAVYGLAETGLPLWACFLIVAAIYLLIAVILLLLAKRNLQKAKGPEQAVAEMQKTKDIVGAITPSTPPAAPPGQSNTPS